MSSWSDKIDPATIPDDVLKAERARRNSLLRKNPSGGRNGGRPKGAKDSKPRKRTAARKGAKP